MARSRKAAQDQRSLLIAPRRNVFLGDQIHPIVERSHQAKIGRPIVGLDFLVAVMPLAKHDRFPIVGAESPVDSLCLGFHFCQKLVVATDVSSARCSNLDESEFSFVAWIAFQESLHCKKPLQNALRVVDSIHANAEIECVHA